MQQGHMVRLAAIAGARVHRIALRIQDEYPDPNMVTQEQANEHFVKSGHFYDDQCTEPFCEKWRGIVSSAMASMNGVPQ